jgi:hypothetical protein
MCMKYFVFKVKEISEEKEKTHASYYEFLDAQFYSCNSTKVQKKEGFT